MPRGREQSPRWVGEYVVWWGADDWEFHACVRCGEQLRSARAKRAGYGSGCKRYVTAEQVQAILRKERAACAAALCRREPPPAALTNSAQRRAARRAYIPVDDHRKPPSRRQLGYLRSLAMQTGTTFVTPYTAAAAHVEISNLEARLGRSSRPRGKKPAT